ncbi:MAG: hypothetical protein HQL73_04915 [Magnetococcales bacterium]|nr:hypothetical protein [Magnetococcales bacterium]
MRWSISGGAVLARFSSHGLVDDTIFPFWTKNMDLINKVLVDLRARQARMAAQTDLSSLGVTPATVPRPEKHRTARMAGVAFVVVALSALVAIVGKENDIRYFSLLNQMLEQPRPVANSPQAASETIVVPTVVVPSRQSVRTTPVADVVVMPRVQPQPPLSASPLPASPRINKPEPSSAKTLPSLPITPAKVHPSVQVPPQRTDRGATGNPDDPNHTSVAGQERSPDRPHPAKPDKTGTMIVTLVSTEPPSLSQTVNATPEDQSLTRARTLLEQGRLDEAEQIIQEMIVREGESSAALGVMAVVEQKRGHLEASNRYYNRLVRLEPNQFRWWLGLAINMDVAKRPGEAESFYKQVIKINPSDTQAVLFAQDRLRILADDPTHRPPP